MILGKPYEGDYIGMYTLASRLSVLKQNEMLNLTYRTGGGDMQTCGFTRTDDGRLMYLGVEQTIVFCGAIPMSGDLLEMIIESEPLRVSFKADKMRYTITCDEEGD